MNQQTNTIVNRLPGETELIEQSKYWLKIVEGWKREISRILEKSEMVNASPEIIARVARTAGDLSVFADQLEELYAQIDYHQLHIPGDVQPASEYRHEDLSSRLYSEGERLRNLLTEMFKLDKVAYRRFLC